MLKAVHAQEDREAAVEKSKLVAAKLCVLMLVCSRLRYITTHSWGVRRYINMNLLSESYGNDSEADIA